MFCYGVQGDYETSMYTTGNCQKLQHVNVIVYSDHCEGGAEEFDEAELDRVKVMDTSAECEVGTGGVDGECGLISEHRFSNEKVK